MAPVYSVPNNVAVPIASPEVHGFIPYPYNPYIHNTINSSYL